VLGHLQHASPDFAAGRKGKGLLRRFKVRIHAVDSTVNRFTRLFAVTRSALWERIDLLALLKSYGTASGRFKVIGALNTAWLPGFKPIRT
jgi:hypothetical protein